uniref:Putative LOV domain-containing protein n=1 Tax=Calliergon cordifolium TaxID=671105 RepID=A0A126X1W5_9BRYO|nr:putative LOV domain-containing protein [Calliergon cordifolium]
MSQLLPAASVMDPENNSPLGGRSGHSSFLPSRRSPPNLEALVESLSRSYTSQIGTALSHHEYNFVLSDPRLPDNPIVFASEGFLRMTGYERHQVIGRNCRFLQGPDTDRGTVAEIRDAIREERACQVRILNYSKEGTPFWNLFHLAPVFASDGRVVHYVGVQTPIANELASVGTESCTVEDTPFRGEASEEDEAEPTTIDEAVKQKAALAVQRVTGELTQSSRVAGGLFSDCAANGVVSSSLMLSLTRIQQSLVLADISLPDTPIVHASDVFCELTGYSREEVLGRNCRFLQGPDTDPDAVREIREAIEAEKPCTVRILNYRKDNTPFWNHLHIAPVRGANGKVAYYVGVQLDVSTAEVPMRGDSLVAHAKQLSAVGVVRVAVRSLQGSGLRRTPSQS